LSDHPIKTLGQLDGRVFFVNDLGAAPRYAQQSGAGAVFAEEPDALLYNGVGVTDGLTMGEDDPAVFARLFVGLFGHLAGQRHD